MTRAENDFIGNRGVEAANILSAVATVQVLAARLIDEYENEDGKENADEDENSLLVK